MPKFPAKFSSRASKEIGRFDKTLRLRVGNKIKSLEEDPFPREVERVQKYKDGRVFRVRVGSLRILYIARHNPSSLIVVKVDKRGRVY